MQNQPFLTRLVRMVTLFLSVAFLLLLLSMAGISTCTIRGDYHETTFFVSRSIVPKLACLATVLLLIRFFRPGWVVSLVARLDSDPDYLRRVRRRMTLVLFLISAGWALFTQPTVISDQSEIQTAAEQINYGDLSCLRPEGYVARYPHQLGPVLVTALIQRVVGRDNYIFFQLMNAGMIALCYLYLARYAEKTGFHGYTQIGLFSLGILFFPFLLYSTFIYATIPSLFFSLISFDLAVSYDEHRRPGTALLCAAAMAFAVFLKQNALVFTIALLIHSILITVRSGDIRRLALSCLLTLGTAAVVILPKPLVQQITGIQMLDGCSPYSYLAMGIQDGERAPGWYNSYNNHVYSEGRYNSKAQKEMALDDITTRLNYFRSNPKDALRFFVQKIASEWNNPTFEAFWINEVRGTNIRPASWIRRLQRPTGVDVLTYLLNPLQFLILAFTLISLLESPRQNHSERYLLPLITFVGGFIFHFFWEAKCQYTLPYFMLLLPFASHGLSVAGHGLRTPITAWKTSSVCKRLYFCMACLIFLCLTVCLLESGYLTCNNSEYAEYLAFARTLK